MYHDPNAILKLKQQAWTRRRALENLRPSSKQLEEILPRIEKRTSDLISLLQKQDKVPILKSTKTYLETQRGVGRVSPLGVRAHIIMGSMEQEWQNVISFMQSKNLLSQLAFVMWFDYTQGGCELARLLAGVEDLIGHAPENYMTAQKEFYERVTSRPSSEVRSEIEARTAFYEDKRMLLQEDVSGEALASHYVQRLKESPYSNFGHPPFIGAYPFQVGEFFTAGAEAGRRLNRLLL